jgi:dTDP-4-dehydrorhamnose reductase
MISNNPFHFIYTDADTLDITDMEQVRRFVDDHNIAYMVNCAAFTMWKKPNPIRKWHCESMLWGLKIWARVAHEFDIRLIHISTDYVFDGTSDTPYTKKTRQIRNPCMANQVKGEEAVLKADPSAVIIRTSWLYSELETIS